jgi:hypothetical protein
VIGIRHVVASEVVSKPKNVAASIGTAGYAVKFPHISCVATCTVSVQKASHQLCGCVHGFRTESLTSDVKVSAR